MTPRITNPNSKRRCASDREFLKEVESKAKKPKKEETAPKRPMSKDEMAEKKHEKEFSVEVYVEVAVPRRRWLESYVYAMIHKQAEIEILIERFPDIGKDGLAQMRMQCNRMMFKETEAH